MDCCSTTLCFHLSGRERSVWTRNHKSSASKNRIHKRSATACQKYIQVSSYVNFRFMSNVRKYNNRMIPVVYCVYCIYLECIKLTLMSNNLTMLSLTLKTMCRGWKIFSLSVSIIAIKRNSLHYSLKICIKNETYS